MANWAEYERAEELGRAREAEGESVTEAFYPDFTLEIAAPVLLSAVDAVIELMESAA